MTDLKTLKDLKELGHSPQDKDAWILRYDLKQEAIKWVKEMDIYRSEDYCNGMMDFITKFFNLTEEDLK